MKVMKRLSVLLGSAILLYLALMAFGLSTLLIGLLLDMDQALLFARLLELVTISLTYFLIGSLVGGSFLVGMFLAYQAVAMALGLYRAWKYERWRDRK